MSDGVNVSLTTVWTPPMVVVYWYGVGAVPVSVASGCPTGPRCVSVSSGSGAAAMVDLWELETRRRTRCRYIHYTCYRSTPSIRGYFLYDRLTIPEQS